jgi:hypothetical protein
VLSTNVIDGTVSGTAVAGLVVGGDQALRVDVLAGMAGDDDVIRGRVVVESLEAVGVRRRFPPVKHTVLPGVAASRAGRTSLDRMTVAVQSDGRPWLSWRGPDEAVHPAGSSTLSPMGQIDGVGYPRDCHSARIDALLIRWWQEVAISSISSPSAHTDRCGPTAEGVVQPSGGQAHGLAQVAPAQGRQAPRGRASPDHHLVARKPGVGHRGAVHSPDPAWEMCGGGENLGVRRVGAS